MSMAMPKNTSTKDYVLSGLSAAGGLLIFFAATGGRIASVDLGAVTFTNFTMVMGGLYGAGFLLAPAILMDMNFYKTLDDYHVFQSRMVGWMMLVFVYCLFAGLFTDDFFVACLIMGGTAILGPTVAGLYLEPKQTPQGHMPAHILFFLAGLIAATTP